MSFLARPPESPRGAGRPAEDVDALLRAFFRSEMPVPWPGPAARQTEGSTRGIAAGRTAIGLPCRFALAAAVALIVVGYWSLASSFPGTPAEPGATMNLDRTLGAKGNRLRPGATHRGPAQRQPLSARRGEAVEPTRNGGEALLQWERLPDGLYMRIEEKSPPKR